MTKGDRVQCRASCVFIGGIGLMLLLFVAPALGDAPPTSGSAVFRLLEVDMDTGKDVASGTAFFIDTNGTAITNSHAVGAVTFQPDKYRLLAIVDKEFYAVDVVCASRLPLEQRQSHGLPTERGVTMGRDVAEIRLRPSDFSFSAWLYAFPTGETLTLATAHRSDLPTFPPLALASGPYEGQRVTVVGFGMISPIVSEWSTSGRVEKTWQATDGTTLFMAVFNGRPQPGNSGSPVLDVDGRVVGINTWNSLASSSEAMGQSVSTLKPVCR